MVLTVKEFKGRFVIQTNERPSRYFHCSYPTREWAETVRSNIMADGPLSNTAVNVNFSYPLETVLQFKPKEEFCGFCRGPCTSNHYISPSTDGY